ncbi:MAG TPA: hypothetical protein VMF86_10330, partial [Stellaceae bacterium]|nr:hypothetical protein [Stellaceae bacterium]
MRSTDIANFRLEDWLPQWLSPNDLISALAALAILVAFFAVWQELRGRSPFSRRVAEVAQRRATLRRAALEVHRARRQTAASGLMHQIVTGLNLLRSQRAHDARSLLAQAGIRSDDAMVRYLFARFAAPISLAALVVLDNYGPHLLPIPEGLRSLAPIGGVVIGFFGPDVLIRNIIS